MIFTIPNSNVVEIVPENELEQRIVSSDIFREAVTYNTKGEGHSEKYLGVHIKQILDYIDEQPWKDDRFDLRILGELHDLGKIHTVRSENGNIIGKSHSQHSVDIAREFISDENLLNLIAIHDKYHSFYLDNMKGRFKKEKFIRIYQPADLDKLIRFNYADSNNREKASVIWFEDMCVNLGLRKNKLYEQEKLVLG